MERGNTEIVQLLLSHQEIDVNMKIICILFFNAIFKIYIFLIKLNQVINAVKYTIISIQFEYLF